MRRALQARLNSVHSKAKRIQSVSVIRVGGFEHHGYKLRIKGTLLLSTGRPTTLALRAATRRQAYEVMKYLWLHGLNAGPDRIARPVTFFRAWKLLLDEEARGQPLLDRLRRRPTAARRSLAETARWLAKLHGLSPNGLKIKYNHRARTKYWDGLVTIFRGWPAAERRILRQHIGRIARQEAALARYRPATLVHYDFHPGNILFTTRGIEVIDFTETHISHPLIDVAMLFYQLELQLDRHVPAASLRGWQRDWLAAYKKHSRRLSYSSPPSRQLFRYVRLRLGVQRLALQQLLGVIDARLKKEILAPAR